MDKFMVTVVVTEWRNGVATIREDAYVKRIESKKRFNEIWAMRNRVQAAAIAEAKAANLVQTVG